jgi:hypothetical protein
MKALVLAAAIGSVRQVLAIFIAVLAIAGAAYLGTHRLSNPDHYAYGGCPWYGEVLHGPLRSCSPPTRFAWQIPLAVVIGIGGLGAAMALGGSADRRVLHA